MPMPTELVLLRLEHVASPWPKWRNYSTSVLVELQWPKGNQALSNSVEYTGCAMHHSLGYLRHGSDAENQIHGSSSMGSGGAPLADV